MLYDMINNFIKNNVIAKGLKLKALTTNKTSGIFEYSNNFKNECLKIERA